MGVNLKDLVVRKEIRIDELRGRVLAVDSMNMLYQFLTTIRQRDGSLLKDSKGRVTSHLNGLFNRVTRFMQKGLKLVFVFDGEAPALKAGEREKRAARKKEAALEYEKAEKRGDVEGMRKYARRTAILTKEMVEQAKELLRALGLPIVQAPSEGEAQAAYLVKKGEAYAVASSDFDNLLFGSPLLVRNLSIEGRRKRVNKLSYDVVRPELISLSETLNKLGIDQEQLIVLGILVGTDYCPGVKGVGPKTALKLVRGCDDFEQLFKGVDWDWKEVFYTIKKMPVTDDYSLKWGEIDGEKVKEMLVEDYDFSVERVERRLKGLLKEREGKKQKGLGQWF